MSPPRIPPFESLYLQSIGHAILKRRKAISNHLKNLALERGIDRRGDVTFERLDLHLRFQVPPGTTLHFTAWEDSMAWVSIRQIRKKIGWTFKAGLHAELWHIEPGEIVQRIEATMAMKPSSVRRATPEDMERIKEVWAAPPKSVGRKNERRR